MKNKNLKIAIITISDRASNGTYQDLSGPAAKQTLENILTKNTVHYELKIISDEISLVKETLVSFINQNFDLILTTGGTGIGPRDITPEATKAIIEKEIPGISEGIRNVSMQFTKNTMLSRAIAGLTKNSLIINLPGSPKAVKEIIEFLGNTIEHAFYMIKGEDIH